MLFTVYVCTALLPLGIMKDNNLLTH